MATTSYKVYRDDANIASPSVKTFTDTGLTNDTQYGYQVSAVIDGVEGPKTNKVFATPVATPVTPPGPTPPTPPSGYTDVPVPPSIDDTGATNVLSPLLTFLNQVGQNKRVVLPNNSLYRVDTALKIQTRNNVWLEGQGTAEIRAHGTGFTEDFSVLYFQANGGGNNSIYVSGIKLTGSSPTSGTFISGHEGQHGVLVDGGSNFEILGCTGSGFFGDFVEVNSGASNVRIHDNNPTNAGRNGVSIIYGHDVDIYNNSFPHSGYMPFDIEPNNSGQPCYNIKYRSNTSGYWSNAFFAIDGSGTGALFHDIEITDNISTGKSLLTVVTGPGRKTRVTFSRNSSNVSASGPVLQFSHVDGLIAQSNHQTLSSGSLISTNDCPSPVITPNS